MNFNLIFHGIYFYVFNVVLLCNSMNARENPKSVVLLTVQTFKYCSLSNGMKIETRLGFLGTKYANTEFTPFQVRHF